MRKNNCIHCGASSKANAHATDSPNANIRAAAHIFVPRPTVVCLCGSSRFFEAFQQANYDETMAGHIVLSIGFYPHSAAHGEGVGHDSEQKIALDDLHKRKIDICDEVFVLNVGGYIGESTRSEIDYAIMQHKEIRYLESIEPPTSEEHPAESTQDS